MPLSFRYLSGLIVALVGSAVQADPMPALTLTRSASKIELTLSEQIIPAESRLRWVIRSGRNQPIVKMRDRSPHAPSDYQYPPETAGREIWFPVLDLSWDQDFTAVAHFNQVTPSDTVALNGNFRTVTLPLQERTAFTAPLEHWENQLFVSSDTAVLDDFYIEKIAVTPYPESQIRLTLTTLTPDWFGSVEVWREGDHGAWTQLAQAKLDPLPAPSTRSVANDDLSRVNLVQALSNSLEFLLNSQNTNPLSPTAGGLFLFYDLDAQTYRRPDWIWTYGPAIKLLIDAASRPEIARHLNPIRLRNAARNVAELSLRFQLNEASHPADGLVLCRFDPRTDTAEGAEGYYSPADSWFLAGWGWLPYFNATGDNRFLAAAVRLTEAIARVQQLDPVIEQDYLMKDGRWKNWTMDESGFGMIGAARVYSATGKAKHRDIGRRYLQGLLDVLEREDGLWDRTWHRNVESHADNGWPVRGERGQPVLIKSRRTTRGTGWAMIGLLATHEMIPEGDVYLTKAIRLSDHLLESQANDGRWDFFFAGGPPDTEPSAKGTALWSLLFYQLHAYTKDPRHLIAARNALEWCLRQRYVGPDPHAQGGLPEINRESGVVYRRWNELICGYTVSWFGLAIMEELKVQDQDHHNSGVMSLGVPAD